MGLRANFWKFFRSGDVIALVELLFLPWGGGPTQIYMSYASPLINTWKKDRIFAIGRRFGNKGSILHCFNINGVFLEQRSLPFRPRVMFMDLNLTGPNFVYNPPL